MNQQIGEMIAADLGSPPSVIQGERKAKQGAAAGGQVSLGGRQDVVERPQILDDRVPGDRPLVIVNERNRQTVVISGQGGEHHNPAPTAEQRPS